MSDVPMPPPPPQPPAMPSGTPGGVDIGAAISYGWNKTMQYFTTWLLVVLVLLGVEIVLSLITQPFASNTFMSVLLSVVSIVVGLVVSLGVYRLSLAVTAGEKPAVGDLFKTDNLGDYVVAAILAGLAIWVGLILCIIPGLILAVLLGFFAYFVLDQNAGGTDALKASWDISLKNFWGLVGLYIVMGLINILGALLCGIGLLVTIPLTWT
ncbi:MAG: hypothetical protein WAN48_02940, partial [Actinomycetes bacterium]